MKIRVAVTLPAILSAIGCSNPTPVMKVSTPAGRQWSDAITNGQPFIDFIKIWHMQMTAGVSLRVTSTYRPWLDKDCHEGVSCDFSFSMRQGDNPDKWVTFDCDAVAEKIIQTDLVPLAEKDCSLLRDEARQYWEEHPDPDNFTDSNGRVWRRQ